MEQQWLSQRGQQGQWQWARASSCRRGDEGVELQQGCELMGLWRLGWGKHSLSYEYSRITWNYMLGNLLCLRQCRVGHEHRSNIITSLMLDALESVDLMTIR